MILYYLLVLTLPLINHPLLAYSLGGLTVEKWLGLACFAYALGVTARRRRAIAPAAPARAFFLLYLIVAISLLGFGATAPGNLFWVLTSQLLFLAATLCLVDSLVRLRRTLLAAISSLEIASLFVIHDWLAGSAVWGNAYRPGAVTGDANYFTAGAVLMLPVAVFFFTERGSRRERVYCLGVVAVTLLAVMLAASRGGSLAMAAAGVPLLLRSRRRWRSRAMAAALIALLAAVAPVSPLRRWLHPSSGDRQSSQNRVELWQAGMAMLAAHPWSGVGVGNFKSQLALYAPPNADLDFIAHNTYIEIGAETGAPGLAAFLLLLLATAIALARARRRAPRGGGELTYWAAAGLEAGLIGFLVAAFFLSAAFLKLFWLVVFLAALLPGMAKLEAESAATSTAAAGEAAPAARRRVARWLAAAP